MIFYLKFSLDNLKSVDNISAVSFIEFLSSKIRKGEHAFIGSIELFKGLAGFPGISHAASKLLSIYSRKLTFMGQFMKVEKYCVVQWGDDDNLITNTNLLRSINLRKIIIDESWEFYFSESIIIFENLSEHHVYRKIFDIVSSFRGDSFKINFSPRHGGGNDTYSIAEHEFTDKYNVFCICDSDIKYHKSGVGQTARNIQRIFNKYDRPNFYLVLDVLEVENLIPSMIYSQTARHEQLKSVSFIEHMERHFPEHLLCYDIKDSHTYKSVYCTDNEFSIFWKPPYDSFLDNEKIAEIKNDYENGNHDRRMLPKLSGLCRVAKDKFLEQRYNDIDVPLRLMSQWDKIYCFMFNFLISSPSMRV